MALPIDYFVLGNVFMFNFYTIFDLDNSRVGVALHIYSQGSLKEDVLHPDPTDPTNPNNPKIPSAAFPTWGIIIIVVGAVILVGLVVFISFRRCRKGPKKEMANGIQEDILE